MIIEWVGIIVFLAVNINHTVIGLNQTADFLCSVRTSTTSQFTPLYMCVVNVHIMT